MIISLVLVLVFLVSAGLARRLATTTVLSVLDHPNHRSLHSVPRPRNGGLAVLAGLALGYGVLVVLAPTPWLTPESGRAAEGLTSTANLVSFGALVLVAVVSFFDDRRDLPALLRLGLHVLAATAVVAAGVVVRGIEVPGWGWVPFGSAAGPLSVLYVVWMSNLFNFMDGMDGLAGSMAVLGFGCLGLFAWGSGEALELVAALTAAAAAGFLLSNYPPARIFMGDVGSVPLGFLAATATLSGVGQGVFDLWVPILAFSPFVVDATVVVIRRAFRGERLWDAHRQHAYQRLILSGWTHRQVLHGELLLMVASVGAAAAYASSGPAARAVVLVTSAVGYVSLFRLVGYVERR